MIVDVSSMVISNCSAPLSLLLLLLWLLCPFVAVLLSSLGVVGNQHAAAAVVRSNLLILVPFVVMMD